MKILQLIIIIAFPVLLYSQECRYNERIFDSVTRVSNIIYSTSQGIPTVYFSEAFTTTQNLKLDIVEPFGDTAQKRALIIFAHPGGFVSGSRLSDDMVSLCDSFSKRGYITATIDYRMNFNLLSSNSAERAVWRATQDASAAIRFFKANASIYKIDTTKIFFWGSSAGSFMGIHLAYVDDTERPQSTFSATLQPDLGCKDCTGVTSPYSSNIAGVIACWGAISDTNWMNNNLVPLLLFHGDADAVVPITEGSPFNLATLPSVHGSAHMHDYLVKRNISHQYHNAIGEPHEYWGTSNGTFKSTGPTIYWKDIINKSRDFMLSTMGLPLICSNILPLNIFTCKAAFETRHTVKISWDNPSVEHPEKFLIEYSKDAISWQTAGSLQPSAGMMNYTFYHDFGSGFSRLYYRVRVVVKNGKDILTPVVYVNFNKNSQDVVVYPNPANNSVQIRMREDNFDHSTQLITITDQYGKIVREQIYSYGQPIDLKDLNSGVYFLIMNKSGAPVKLVIIKN